MTTIEIARKLAALNQPEDAVKAYVLFLGEPEGEPAARLEAAAYILQNRGDYRISYTCFLDLYRQGMFREDILPLLTAVFYEPNRKQLKSRYERNVKLLSRYPYLFRRNFPSFDDLPVRFFPYDDRGGYVPFRVGRAEFGGYVKARDPVVSRNFFKDLDRPVLAENVFSQYELEYLKDTVRRSEDVGRENHIYLHYTDWGEFCSWLQVLNFRPLLESKKFVFLIEEEIGEYPIDFKERFGVDYGQYPVKPVGIREVHRLIWHTQLSTHNGGDFFNEVFDAHPNLLAIPSIMFEDVEECMKRMRAILKKARSVKEICGSLDSTDARLMNELFNLRDLTDKDLLVAYYMLNAEWNRGVDPNSRIAPALFFQPHFSNIVYELRADSQGNTVLTAENVEEIHKSQIFKGFKYIKTFTPMRRFTTSHAATVRFMYLQAIENNKERKEDEKIGVVSDAVSERVFNRSFMVDPEDRLYHDSCLVRFEDAKLNPKATFTALAAFLDLPYTESMEVCSEKGVPVPYLGGDGYAPGFSPAQVYQTYDEYINDSERYFIEYFLRDAYEFYGYDFQTYEGAPVDEAKAEALIHDFTKVNEYMRKTWIEVFRGAEVTKDGERLDAELEGKVQEALLENYLRDYEKNRIENAKILLEGLRFVNENGQPLRFMKRLELDPALMEQPLYH